MSPLWSEADVAPASSQCPLYPRKRTSGPWPRNCQKQTSLSDVSCTASGGGPASQGRSLFILDVRTGSRWHAAARGCGEDSRTTSNATRPKLLLSPRRAICSSARLPQLLRPFGMHYGSYMSSRGALWLLPLLAPHSTWQHLRSFEDKEQSPSRKTSLQR